MFQLFAIYVMFYIGHLDMCAISDCIEEFKRCDNICLQLKIKI